ncbi:FRAS1-related extracellular matrix protein 2, partial [Geodia barretti]
MISITNDTVYEQLVEEFISNLVLVTDNANVIVRPARATVMIFDDDIPAPVFEMTMYTVPEDDPGSVRLCVDIGVEITEPITYTITTAQKNPPQAEDSDFTGGTTITIAPPGTESCTNFSDLVVNDNIGLEGNEAFTILIDGSMAMVTITEDDDVSIGFNPTAYMVLEGGSVDLIIERMGDAEDPVVATVLTRDGSATAGEDYVRLDGVEVTFLPGEFTQTVTLNTMADLPAEGDEDLVATLSAVDARVDVTQPNATVVITDDVVPTISFSTSNYVVGEGDGTVEVCLQLNVPLVADIDFTVTAASGTATADEDFVDEEQRAVFPIGETRACIDFKITDDRLQENDEIFTVAFSSRPGITTGDPATATVTIIDNDDPEPEFDQTMYTVPENNRTLPLCIDIGVLVSEAMEFTITASNKNPPEAQEADFNPSTTITVPAGGSMACIDFTGLVVDDNIALEGDQSFTISVGGSTSMVVIVDDDIPLIESGDVTINEDGGIAVVNVRLLNEIENDFVLDYSTGEVPDGAD